MATLDLRTSKDLKIIAESDKNFSVNLSGDVITDTAYTLTMTSSDNSIENVFNGSTLVTGLGSIDLVFDHSDYKEGNFNGVLESVSKDADKYLKINIELSLT